jgi:hypothetical protein
MKYFIVAITLLSGAMLAQSAPQPDALPGPNTTLPPGSSPAYTPSYSQLYCSGFVTARAIPRTNFVLGSKDSPHADTFPGHTQLFLDGPGLVEGQRYSLLRQIKDPDRETSSPELRARFEKLGALYQELGWVTVHSVIQGVTVASFDFACDAALRGDIVVPYEEKLPIAYRTVEEPVEAFRASSSAVKGHVLASKDFVGLLGTGNVVYSDFGTAKGARPGDYLFVLRGYAPGDLNRIDRASESLPKNADFAAVKPAILKADADARLPLHVLGEMLVLNATPEASTAIITRSFSEMELGDVIEAEEAYQGSVETVRPPANECGVLSRLHQLILLHPHACRDSKKLPEPAP